MSLYDQYVQLHIEKKEIEAKLSDKKEEIKQLEAQMLDKWAEEGLQSVKMPGGKSLWLDHKFWASAGGEIEELVEGLCASGMEDMVKQTVNRNSLSALIREYADPLDDPETLAAKLPAELQGRVKITETTNIRVRGI